MQVVASLRRLRQLDWVGTDRHTGFRWEAIGHLKAPNGAKMDSLRLSQKVRAVAYRDGDFLRLAPCTPIRIRPTRGDSRGDVARSGIIVWEHNASQRWAYRTPKMIP
jgi:hypothetical protein